VESREPEGGGRGKQVSFEGSTAC